MALRVAINGFGRIGRLALRSLVESKRDDIEIVGINDPAPIDIKAHLLRHDSTHGMFPTPVQVEGNEINVGRGPIRFSRERDPSNAPWRDLKVDIALECTGIFTSKDKAWSHITAGARRVLISAPGEQSDLTVVYGINEDKLTGDHLIVSNASCTTNCLAPVAKVIHDAVGIEKGFMTTVHSYTGDQRTLDSTHKDPYRARAACVSMIPTSTGAARAVGHVLPELAGRIDGVAIRVPTPNVSMIDLKVTTSRTTSVEDINHAISQAAASDRLRGILCITDEPLVSIDFNHNPASAIVAKDQTKVIKGDFIRVMAWYDNEWGFSNRMLDTIAVMGKFL